jgi:hypothetical protein
MSAFLCSPKHIATLARAVEKDPQLQWSAEEAVALFATENADSVGCAHNQSRDEVARDFGGFQAYRDACRTAGVVDVAPLHILKLAQSLIHQSGEHDGWKHSRAKPLLAALIESQISKLPGYDSAPWSI